MARETARSGREPVYEVVWPLGQTTGRLAIKPSAPIIDLNGKTVAEFWDWAFKGDQMFPIIREKLRGRFPDVKFVGYDTFGDIHGPNETEVVAALPALLRQHGIDAVISGVGA